MGLSYNQKMLIKKIKIWIQYIRMIIMLNNEHKPFIFEPIFYHLLTCQIKTETNPGSALKSRVKLWCSNIQNYIGGASWGAGARGYLQMFEEIKEGVGVR